MTDIVAVRERAKPTYGPNHRIRVTARTHTIGQQAPYFSVTADIFKPGARDIEAGGCLHEDAVKAWPAIAPIVALHLSDATTGTPMHAEANAWYWLAGVQGGAGERYHGGNSTPERSRAECLAVLLSHLRVPADFAPWSLVTREQLGMLIAHVLAPQWQAEADAGRALLASLVTV